METPSEFSWNIPDADCPDAPRRIPLPAGAHIFIVGPNGSGKSALLNQLAAQARGRKVKRLLAHRQNWLSASTIDLTARARRSVESQIQGRQHEPQARWKDDHSAQRLSAVLFDLVATENQRARRVTGFVDSGALQEASQEAMRSGSCFARLNGLLAHATLSARLHAAEGEEILARHGEGAPFSMAMLSDGERNAVIISATVLTAEPDTLFLIDEPERHIHRSIVTPLIRAIFDCRPDCIFAVSTHELALPAGSFPEATVVLPRGCNWNGDTPTSWRLDVLSGDDALPEDLREAVLGSRKRIVFVEGEATSLDVPIYSALFSDTSVVAKGGCADVQRAVKGLRDAEGLHWISAFGLIDRDDRGEAEVQELEAAGIYALKVSSVEALYYLSTVRGAVAEKQARLMRLDSAKLMAAADAAALQELAREDTITRLCARRCERRIRDSVWAQLPSWKDILEAPSPWHIEIASPLAEEVANYRGLLDKRDLDGLCSRYAVRESAALVKFAENLQFRSRSNYESAVVASLSEDDGLRGRLCNRLGSLAKALAVPTEQRHGKGGGCAVEAGGAAAAAQLGSAD